MITLLPAYSITIKVGEKLFAGHVDNSLSIVPNYEPVLRKATGGRFDLDFVSVDLDMQISGLTYARGDAEAATHNDYADLRAACNNVTQVAFVYGDMTPGKVVMVGYAKLSEYQENAGPAKTAGNWSCRLRSVRGSVQEQVVPPAVQDVKYGLLYNNAVVYDVRNVCAAGWHIPTITQFDALTNYLGGYAIAGDKLKELGTDYWDGLNADATNEVNFNLRGASYRSNIGSFLLIKQIIYCWTSSLSYDPLTMGTTRRGRFDDSAFGHWNINIKTGCSLRPMKDSTSLSHGESGVYVGNDGRVYRTICIGTQEWLADNLVETKFRTGEDIPEVTDNTAWAALTTAGMCAYNNDWSNV